MITHDQFEKKYPRADLIRFKCLGESLQKNSIEVVYVASNDRGRFEESFYKGSKVFKVPFVSRVRMIQILCFYLFLIPALLTVRKHRPFHIIFVNSVLSIPYACFFKWFCRNGHIQFDLMGILSEEKFLRRSKNLRTRTAKRMVSSIEDFLLSRVDFITTINDQHKRILLNRVRRPVYVVRDGVFNATLQRASVARDPIENGKILLIFVGQVSHFRLDPLFRLLPELVTLIPNLHVQVGGVGPQLERYRGMVESGGLAEYVTFLGHVPYENVFDTIAKADIAYSDDWSINGFPMKLFDYMALGKAIIAEGTESVKELLINQVNGLLYRTEAEMKEKIVALAKDVALRKRLGQTAREMMDLHTWEKRVEALGALYYQFLGLMGI